MPEDSAPSEEEKGAGPDAAEAGPGLVNRLRGVPRAVGGGVSGAVDAATGNAFREQFDGFTDAVTTSVIGVHQDQKELAERLASLERRLEVVEEQLRRVSG